MQGTEVEGEEEAEGVEQVLLQKETDLQEPLDRSDLRRLWIRRRREKRGRDGWRDRRREGVKTDRQTQKQAETDRQTQTETS